MQTKNQNQNNALPEQQNVQAQPTAPQAGVTNNEEAGRGSSGEAPCSAAASSENFDPAAQYTGTYLALLGKENFTPEGKWINKISRNNPVKLELPDGSLVQLTPDNWRDLVGHYSEVEFV